jgi:hypothetical protein
MPTISQQKMIANQFFFACYVRRQVLQGSCGRGHGNALSLCGALPSINDY